MVDPSKEKVVKRKAFEINKQAQVLVFDEGKYGIKRRAPDANLVGNKRKHEEPEVSAPKDADDVADLEVSEIWEKLKDTVEDVHASNLKGKERKRYVFEKVTRLGGEPPKKQLAPMNIRIGITEKQRAREAKRQAQAREMDLVTTKNRPNTSRSRKGRRK